MHKNNYVKNACKEDTIGDVIGIRKSFNNVHLPGSQ